MVASYRHQALLQYDQTIINAWPPPLHLLLRPPQPTPGASTCTHCAETLLLTLAAGALGARRSVKCGHRRPPRCQWGSRTWGRALRGYLYPQGSPEATDQPRRTVRTYRAPTDDVVCGDVGSREMYGVGGAQPLVSDKSGDSLDHCFMAAVSRHPVHVHHLDNTQRDSNTAGGPVVVPRIGAL